MENVIPDFVQIICTQTTMTEEDAKTQLELCNNDYMKVIRQHYNIDVPDSRPITKSVNQEIYSQIRKKIAISNEKRKI